MRLLLQGSHWIVVTVKNSAWLLIGSSCTSLTYGPRFALTLTKAIEHDQPKVRNVRLDVDNRIENR